MRSAQQLKQGKKYNFRRNYRGHVCMRKGSWLLTSLMNDRGASANLRLTHQLNYSFIKHVKTNKRNNVMVLFCVSFIPNPCLFKMHRRLSREVRPTVDKEGNWNCKRQTEQKGRRLQMEQMKPQSEWEYFLCATKMLPWGPVVTCWAHEGRSKRAVQHYWQKKPKTFQSLTLV